MPTASAVMGDIVDIAGNLLSGRAARPAISIVKGGSIQPITGISTLYYIRLMVEDKPNVLSEISGALGRFNISIESVIQKGRDSGGAVPLVIMTHRAFEKDMLSAMLEINQLDSVAEKGILIRVESSE